MLSHKLVELDSIHQLQLLAIYNPFYQFTDSSSYLLDQMHLTIQHSLYSIKDRF